jgi:alkanesulfonate monooxygenase SsuD/methylene tetrahydromethanopterin reductase-like flavin-dependent oxidoreductase (luciferase family)
LNVVSSPQGRPVIIMAGTSPRGQRFAVANADMVIAHKNSVADMRTYSEQLRRALAEAGRDPASCKIFFSIKPVMGDTPALAQERWDRNYQSADVEAGLADLSSTLGYDMSKFDLDKPLPPDLPVQAIAGKLLQYTQSERALTLREIAKHEAMHETFPICGTPEHVADVLEHAAQVGGADGFHFRGAFGDLAYLTEVTTKLMPVLQRRGLARKEYSGQTLRNHLFEF